MHAPSHTSGICVAELLRRLLSFKAVGGEDWLHVTAIPAHPKSQPLLCTRLNVLLGEAGEFTWITTERQTHWMLTFQESMFDKGVMMIQANFLQKNGNEPWWDTLFGSKSLKRVRRSTAVALLITFPFSFFHVILVASRKVRTSEEHHRRERWARKDCTFSLSLKVSIQHLPPKMSCIVSPLNWVQQASPCRLD